MMRLYAVLGLFLLLTAGCQNVSQAELDAAVARALENQAVAQEVVRETVEVEVTVEMPVTVEIPVTVEVPVTVERILELEVTREVPVTRIVEVVVTATPAPTATPTPQPAANDSAIAAPPPSNLTQTMLDSMRATRRDMETYGGLVDHAMNTGYITCEDAVNSYDRITASPTFDIGSADAVQEWAYNNYRQAVAIVTNGGKDMAENCRNWLINPVGGGIPFQQWSMARGSVGDALNLLIPAIERLEQE